MRSTYTKWQIVTYVAFHLSTFHSISFFMDRTRWHFFQLHSDDLEHLANPNYARNITTNQFAMVFLVVDRLQLLYLSLAKHSNRLRTATGTNISDTIHVDGALLLSFGFQFKIKCEMATRFNRTTKRKSTTICRDAVQHGESGERIAERPEK